MSDKYKFLDTDNPYFVSFTIVKWIDVFTRRVYKDIFVDNLNYCIKEKGLIVWAWVLMTNHVHMIISSNKEPLENIMRDFKGFTSKTILKAIKENQQESRKDWLLSMFEKEGKKIQIIKNINFGNNIIIQLF